MQNRLAVVLALPAAALMLLSGCKKTAQGPPPPPEVAVLEVQPAPIDLQVELMGTIEASRSVQVRSQVTGVILERPYTEGALVNAGDVLFRIDSTQYAAAYRSALAQLADASARAANAERNVNRLRPLLADNAIARRDVDDAEAELARARAAMDNARGTVERTRKDFDETTVRAQLAGRAGRALLVEGSRVTGSSDLLTTIEALDPVYVTFRPSAQQLLAWRRDAASTRALAPGGSARVQLVLADGTTLPRTGRIDFIDPVADRASGTQAWRATFTNGDRLLVPGQFVRTRILGLVHQNALVVPQRAVTDQIGRQGVYIVLPGDSVALRDVTTGSVVNGQVEIAEGLQAGDRVIVDGVQKVRPGARVRPVPLAPDTAKAGS